MHPKRRQRQALSIVGLVLLFIAITYSYLVNGFGVALWGDWSQWQLDSESEVLLRVEADLLGRDVSPLGNLMNGTAGFDTEVYERLASLEARPGGTYPPLNLRPYESMIGGWAHAVSFLWRSVGLDSVSYLRALSSTLMALSVIGMFLGLRVVRARGLSWAWLAAMAFSPWITYAARNLYWASWLWFVPAMLAVVLVTRRSPPGRLLAAGGVFLAFLLKYIATGYELFTSLTILAAAIPVVAILFQDLRGPERVRQIWNATLVAAASAGAFAVAIAIQANLMADSMTDGLARIWNDVVLKRTWADASAVDPTFAESVTASPLRVIWKYLYEDWTTNLLHFSFDKSGSVVAIGLGPTSFILLLAASLLVVVLRVWQRDERWVRDLVLLLLGLASATSWFVAAKGHSYMHTHVLFFLWYLLAVPAMLYISADFVVGEMRSRRARLSGP